MWKGAALVTSLPWGATAQFRHDAPDFSVAGPYSQWTKNALHEAPGGKPACRGSQGHSLKFCPVRGKQTAQGIGSVVVWIFFCHIFDYLIECLALGLPPQAPPGGIMPPAPRNVLYLFLGQQTGVVPQPRNVMRIAAASLNNLL